MSLMLAAMAVRHPRPGFVAAKVKGDRPPLQPQVVRGDSFGWEAPPLRAAGPSLGLNNEPPEVLEPMFPPGTISPSSSGMVAT